MVYVETLLWYKGSLISSTSIANMSELQSNIISTQQGMLKYCYLIDNVTNRRLVLLFTLKSAKNSRCLFLLNTQYLKPLILLLPNVVQIQNPFMLCSMLRQFQDNSCVNSLGCRQFDINYNFQQTLLNWCFKAVINFFAQAPTRQLIE